MDYALLLSLSAVCTALSGVIISILKVSGNGRIGVNWLVAFVLCFAGVYSGLLPQVCEPLWLCALLEMIGVGLMANGWADQAAIKKILSIFYPPKESGEITIEAEAPDKDTPMARLMKLQNELSQYIKIEDGKVKLTLKDNK